MSKKYGKTFGSGSPGEMDETRRQWRKATRGHSGKTSCGASIALGGGVGLAIGTQEWVKAKIAEGDISGGVSGEQSGTSIFDPVLCELVYRWFCPEGGAILDPFAGGSVRGIVAAKLGYQYTGIDLRPEQIAANVVQAEEITPDNPPRWIVGDSRQAAALSPGEYDLVFSCPPYGDLERYSDDPADLSTFDHVMFIEAMRTIVSACVAMLKPNRFACFVVGDFRDKKGFYRNFVSDTIAAFENAGARLYNEAVLITAVGSLPIRVGKQFEGYRKLGKTHQNVLVFYKGNPKAIPSELGEVVVNDIVETQGEIAADASRPSSLQAG